jgi:hypothetical protein
MSSVVGKIAFLIATMAANGALTYVLVARSEQAQREQLKEALENRPPVAVLAPASFVRDAQDQEGIESGLREAYAAAGRLREGGYLVLDEQQVLDAPEHLKVSKP